MTLDTTGRMLLGSDIGAALAILSMLAPAPFAAGTEAADVLKRLKSYADVALNPALLDFDGWLAKYAAQIPPG